MKTIKKATMKEIDCITQRAYFLKGGENTVEPVDGNISDVVNDTVLPPVTPIKPDYTPVDFNPDPHYSFPIG